MGFSFGSWEDIRGVLVRVDDVVVGRNQLRKFAEPGALEFIQLVLGCLFKDLGTVREEFMRSSSADRAVGRGDTSLFGPITDLVVELPKN